MGILADIQELAITKKTPKLRTGQTVRVHQRIKEGEKERIQIFEGIIIAIKGKQSSSPMITVRKVSGGVGVELILPILSPNIEKIEIVKRAKVRRGKLYYLRSLTTKRSRLKYKDLSEFIVKEEPAVAEESLVELAEPVAEKTETKK